MEADSRTSRGLVPDSGEGRTWFGLAGKLLIEAAKLVKFMKAGDLKALRSRNNIRRKV